MKNRTREYLDEHGIKKFDVANKLGITQVGLQLMMNTDHPKIGTVEKVAKVLGVPTWRLLLEDKEIKEVKLTK